MTLKHEFQEKFTLSLWEFAKHKDATPETVWAWIEDKLDKARIEGEVGKYELSIKLARIKAIDDAIELIFDTCEPYFFNRTSDYTASDILNILTILRARVEKLKENK